MNARHLNAACDNVLASLMGSCALQAGDPKRTDVGDSIDRGLILLRLLNDHGFTVTHPGWMIHNVTEPVITNATRAALRSYHHALDTRKHGGIAADALVSAIETALGTPWVQGATLTEGSA